MMIPVDFGLDMADGVGIMRRSCCGPKEVWEISLSGKGNCAGRLVCHFQSQLHVVQ